MNENDKMDLETIALTTTNQEWLQEELGLPEVFIKHYEEQEQIEQSSALQSSNATPVNTPPVYNPQSANGHTGPPVQQISIDVKTLTVKNNTIVIPKLRFELGLVPGVQLRCRYSSYLNLNKDPHYWLPLLILVLFRLRKIVMNVAGFVGTSREETRRMNHPLKDNDFQTVFQTIEAHSENSD